MNEQLGEARQQTIATVRYFVHRDVRSGDPGRHAHPRRVRHIKDLPLERYYRDEQLMVIGEGTNEIQKLVIASRRHAS